MRLAALALVLLLAGCYGNSTSPTPGDSVDVLAELAANGATVTDAVAGDAGCSDESLQDNARRLDLTLAADGKPYTVFLFRWRNQAEYAAASSAFYLCVSQYADHRGSVHVETVEVSPWRAYGPDWGRGMHDALQSALAGAATGQ
jgi:hypothetical protein